jgi:2-succinyl-5-enolpyruvyl-6-hydroxy-3-cyclohexene-1-carboxylate synthase
MLDAGNLTLGNAHLLLKTLHSLGVCYFCLSPGSRSVPLNLAATELPHIVHFDERGLGFHALGYAKAKKAPVAIIVTSGTAVANLFPAIAEAFTSHVPLIIISADRPFELRDCGANQTLDQVKIFSSCTYFETDIPLSDPIMPPSYLLSTASFAVKEAISKQGPVHINCMIREPFFSSKETFPPPSFCTYEPIRTLPLDKSFEILGKKLSSYQKGVILLGMDALDEDLNSFLYFAEKLKWPILADIISNGRSLKDHPLFITHPDILIKTGFTPKVDAILQIGSRIVSKTIASWIETQKAPHFLVTNHSSRYDPQSRISHVMQCQTNDFCEKITPHLQNNDYGWSSIWKNSSTVIEKELKQFFSKNTAFSEPSIANFLEDVDHLFLANSMPNRDADLFLFSEKTTFWANRGVSGIDGNIATVTGLAAALKKPIVALLGDMTALHDINSLALVSQIETPIYFIVINNLGGGIFSFLPISQKEDFCNEFFSINPSYSLTCLSKGFSLSSFSVSSHEELKDVWEKTQGKSCLIECKTDRKENVLHHQMIYERIAKCFTINLTEIADSHLSSSCTAS